MAQSNEQGGEELVTELRRLLAIHTMATEQARRLGLQPPDEVVLGGFVKAILADRKQYELDARIDELEGYAWSDHDGNLRYAEERIEELKEERHEL